MLRSLLIGQHKIASLLYIFWNIDLLTKISQNKEKQSYFFKQSSLSKLLFSKNKFKCMKIIIVCLFYLFILEFKREKNHPIIKIHFNKTQLHC
jgi:hypothetical protein